MSTLQDLADANLALRLVSRFRSGAVADPESLLRKLRQNLDAFDEFVSDAHKLQDLCAESKQIMARNAMTDEQSKELSAQVSRYNSSKLRIELAVTRGYTNSFHSMWELSMAVLQRYSLPAALRKKVEAISKFWATKQKPRRPKLPKGFGFNYYDAVISLYLKYVEDTREQLGIISEAMTKGRPIAEGDAQDPSKVKAGPFTLINTGGFSDDIMQSVAEVVKKSAEYASTSGFGQVCYGEVNVSQKIGRQNTLAFYMIQQDEMFVRADAKASENFLHNILHELGHRYQLKFLKNKSAPRRLYMIIGNRHQDEIYKNAPKKGDVVKDPKSGKEYEVTGLAGTTVHLRHRLDPDIIEKVQEQARKEVLNKRPELAENKGNNAIILQYATQAAVDTSLKQLGATPAKIHIEGYYDMKGIDPRSTIDFQGFISQYAARDPDENFSEMFSFYCRGDLPPTQSALFEEQVFGKD